MFKKFWKTPVGDKREGWLRDLRVGDYLYATKYERQSAHGEKLKVVDISPNGRIEVMRRYSKGFYIEPDGSFPVTAFFDKVVLEKHFGENRFK